MNKINWPQAIAEVVLILVGVAIALAADSWIKDRSNRELEKVYLENLQLDFLENQKSLQEVIGITKNGNKDTLALLNMIESGKLDISDEELIRLIDSSTINYIFESTNGTYQDIVSSGNLNLIRNAKLRLKLAQYANGISEFKRVTLAERHNLWGDLQVPFMVSKLDAVAIWSKYFNEPTESENNRTLDRENIVSKEFANILSIRLLSDADVLNVEKYINDDIDEIVELIKQSKKDS